MNKKNKIQKPYKRGSASGFGFKQMFIAVLIVITLVALSFIISFLVNYYNYMQFVNY